MYKAGKYWPIQAPCLAFFSVCAIIFKMLYTLEKTIINQYFDLYSVGFVVFPIMQIHADTYIKFLKLLCIICPSAHVNILHFAIESNFFFLFLKAMWHY